MMLLHPLPGARVTQRFGEHPEYYRPLGYGGHEGVDYSAVVGTPVRAAHDGTAYTRTSSGYGTYIELMGAGMRTVYAHLSEVLRTGPVKAGDVIALTGNTGRTTGPHLHFGVCPLPRDWANGFQGYVDPEPLLAEGAVEMGKHGFGPYVASYQTGAESGPSVDVIVNSDMPYVGQIFEGGVFDGPLWSGPRPKRVFARFWIEGNGLKGDAYEETFVLAGAQGAEAYVAKLRPRYEAARALGILDVKGPNEQHANSDAARQAHKAFWLRWIQLVAAMGMRPWALCWSSGTPPIEEMPFWAPVVTAAINVGGGLSAHHYNAPHLLNDPFGEWPQYGDAWYSCRFELIIDALYAAGVPRGLTGWYLISECGIDGHGIDWHGDPAFAGKRPRYGWRDWRDYGITWESYQQELVAYAQRVFARPEILAVELYISHPRPDWASFNYDANELRWMAEAWTGYVPGVIEPPVVEPPAEYLPSNDPFTLAAIESGDLATMQDKIRWWTEEAVRQLETGNAYGLRIMQDMVRLDGGLMYEAERAAKQ